MVDKKESDEIDSFFLYNIANKMYLILNGQKRNRALSQQPNLDQRVSSQDRRRMYTDQDLETLAQIKSISADGKTLDQIREALGETVIVETDEDQPTSSLAVIPAIIEQYESLDSKLDQVLERLDRIENKPSLWDRLLNRKPSK